MPEYRVHFVAVVSTSVVVEADDGESALELAYEADKPYLNISNHGMDMGDWLTASELFPDVNKPEEDYEEIER